ncbi:apoptosis-enhancing nuclease-like [Heteronotia binoei]|uniref:apoptosis-enhancing nuclease-like n=1 Tax=Heteronotia binoei TaxID=13085 RepID=UPI00292E245E|nr:apoptosis-enhancing nuclease-like [Heteronotia binoei]
MHSSSKHLLGGMQPAKRDQEEGTSLGVDDQLLKCPRHKWDPGQSLNKASPCAEAGRQNRRKSRKHQRCMARRMLEWKEVLRHTLEEETLSMALDSSKTCRIQGQEVSQLTKEEREKELHTLCPAMSVPSAGTTKQYSSSQHLINAVSFPCSSAADANSFCYLKCKSKKPVAIDCEMVGTGPGGKVSELARCSVVNYDGDVIYDKYIQPQLPVVDYRTRWSGITRRHLEKATPFVTARAEILQILKDKIVVGHAIHNDFRALKYFHPQEWTRDTSRSPLRKGKGGLLLKTGVSLKSLAKKFLHKQIQVSREGHSSVEDAQTSMELYRLVEMQWEKDMTGQLSTSPSSSPLDNCTDNDHYMDDQYWPEDLNLDCK